MADIKEVLEQRGNKYGTMEANAETTQGLMRIVENGDSYSDLPPIHKECLHMIMHKISRMVNGDPMYIDNATDIVGYGKLLEDFLIKENDCE